jgi:proteic killer suppression protein
MRVLSTLLLAEHSIAAIFHSRSNGERCQADAIDSASMLNDLKAPLGNRLEALHGDRKGQFSIRIDAQWRICFVWRDNQAWDVEIVDYH